MPSKTTRSTEADHRRLNFFISIFINIYESIYLLFSPPAPYINSLPSSFNIHLRSVGDGRGFLLGVAQDPLIKDDSPPCA